MNHRRPLAVQRVGGCTRARAPTDEQGQLVRHRGQLAGTILLSAGLLAAAVAAPALATTHHKKGTTIATTHTTKYGRVLANSKGRVMYLSANDTHKVSHCTGACAAAWPKVTSKTKPVAGAGISATHLSRTAKHQQVTYYGHPLYYFAGHTKPGNTSGENEDSFFVVGIHGKAIKPKKHKAPAGPTGPAQVNTATVASHEALVGSNGHTLYELSDETGTPAYFSCTGSCTGTWMPLLTKGAPTAAGDAVSADLGTVTRTDDSFTQVTYSNHPLYYYIPDTSAGDNGGEDAYYPPGYWYELAPNGTAIL